MSYTQVSNLIRDGQTILSQGVGRRGASDPLRVVTGAINAYAQANDLFGGMDEPASGTPDHKTYQSLTNRLGDLKDEIRGYARKVANGVANDVDSSVAGVANQVKQERAGRKILGRISYMPRPSAVFVGRGVVNTEAYIKDSKTYVGTIEDTLRTSRVINEDDTRYFERVNARFDDASDALTIEGTRHEDNVDTADIAKTNKKWEEEQARHLRTIREKKWF